MGNLLNRRPKCNMGNSKSRLNGGEIWEGTLVRWALCGRCTKQADVSSRKPARKLLCGCARGQHKMLRIQLESETNRGAWQSVWNEVGGRQNEAEMVGTEGLRKWSFVCILEAAFSRPALLMLNFQPPLKHFSLTFLEAFSVTKGCVCI